MTPELSHRWQKRSSGIGATLGLALLFVVLVAVFSVILAIGGGVVRVSTVQRLIGREPGTVYVLNLRNDAVVVTLQRRGALGLVQYSYEDRIGPGDARTYPDRAVGLLEVRFDVPGDSPLGTCYLTIASKGEYSFAILDNVVAVSQSAREFKRGGELVIGSSPLCQAPLL